MPTKYDLMTLCNEMITVFEKQFTAPTDRDVDKSNINLNTRITHLFGKEIATLDHGGYNELYVEDNMRSSSYEKIIAYYTRLLDIPLECRTCFSVIYDPYDKDNPVHAGVDSYFIIGNGIPTLSGKTLDADEYLFDPNSLFTYEYDIQNKKFGKPCLSGDLGERTF